MDKVEDFFHHISPRALSLTSRRFEHTKEIKYKESNSLNLATEGDFDNEKLIKKSISKWFPQDKIIAEETSSETGEIDKGRVWIVDPICGSANFKRGVSFFCTNIALAHNGRLIASCVIDHSRQEYIWSVGNSKIYINRKLILLEKKTEGILLEVDLSGIPLNMISRPLKLVSYLLRKRNYYIRSSCTSLPFAYIALGRIDAYVNGESKAWDTAAANFLITQAGGIVTQLDGSPWDLLSNNALGAIDKNLHRELLGIMNQ